MSQMRKLLFTTQLLFALLIGSFTYSQSIEVVDGIIFGDVTTTQRNSIPLGANDKAIVNNITTGNVEMWNGSAWVIVPATAADLLVNTGAFNGNLSAADTNVQLALDTLDDLISGGTDDQIASEVPYTNTTSGLTATDVQAAIDEVEARVDANDAKVTNTDSQTLSFANPNLSITGGNSVDISGIDTNTQRTDEEIEDVAGAMVSGNTETLISVTYVDAGPSGTLDFVVNSDLSLYNNATSNFSTGAHTTNTDSQTLSFVDPNLSITGGNSVDLTALKDGTGTDDQTATEVLTTTTNFNGNLSAADTNVQLALETLDDMVAGGGINNVVEDLTPQLGGDLDAQNNSISAVNQITATIVDGNQIQAGYLDMGPTDTPPVSQLGNLYFDNSEATLKQYNGSQWEPLGGGLNNVVEDLTPQLGGPLDINTQAAKSVFSNTDITIDLDDDNNGSDESLLIRDGADNVKFEFTERGRIISEYQNIGLDLGRNTWIGGNQSGSADPDWTGTSGSNATVRLGWGAGQDWEGYTNLGGVSIGYRAGGVEDKQVSIGYKAMKNQEDGEGGIGIGYRANMYGNDSGVNIGYNAGMMMWGVDVGIGTDAGMYAASTNGGAVFIGRQAGKYHQGTAGDADGVIAIGNTSYASNFTNDTGAAVTFNDGDFTGPSNATITVSGGHGLPVGRSMPLRYTMSPVNNVAGAFQNNVIYTFYVTSSTVLTYRNPDDEYDLSINLTSATTHTLTPPVSYDGIIVIGNQQWNDVSQNNATYIGNDGTTDAFIAGTQHIDDAVFVPTDTEPTTTEGAVYWDNSENGMKQYNGSAWEEMVPTKVAYHEEVTPDFSGGDIVITMTPAVGTGQIAFVHFISVFAENVTHGGTINYELEYSGDASQNMDASSIFTSAPTNGYMVVNDNSGAPITGNRTGDEIQVRLISNSSTASSGGSIHIKLGYSLYTY